MNFDISVSPLAIADLDAIHAYLCDFSEAAADNTTQLIEHAIAELRIFPKRYAQAPESRRSAIEIRHLIVVNYRVIYTVIGPRVNVCRILHASQKLNPADLF